MCVGAQDPTSVHGAPRAPTDIESHVESWELDTSFQPTYADGVDRKAGEIQHVTIPSDRVSRHVAG